MKKVLTIAGSDCSGGAGIQADIKTFLANGVYGMSVVTALIAENTVRVIGTAPADPGCLKDQLEAVFEDLPPDAVKIGLIAGEEQVKVISDCIEKYGAGNIVLDPVMVATTGTNLTDGGTIRGLAEKLFPKVRLLTPNLKEAEVILKEVLLRERFSLKTEEEIRGAAETIGSAFGCNVLIKGGHREKGADDILYEKDSAGETFTCFYGERLLNPNTHGTGCTLSSAVAANLAKGTELKESIKAAKKYLSEILTSSLDLGHGSGPLDHGFLLTKENL